MFSPMSYLRVYLHYEALSTELISPPERRFQTTDALHVAKLSPKLNLMASICLYQFHTNHGKTLA